MKHRIAFVATLISLLSACGGGGDSGGNPPSSTLTVDFNYRGTALLWRTTSMDILDFGLQGKTPNCSVISGTLPPGLNISNTGCKISGLPTQIGVSFATIRLTVPGYTGQVDKQIRFEVFGPSLLYGLPLTATQAAVISSTPRSMDLGALGQWSADPGESVTYSVIAGTLPAGLDLNSQTGEIHGILTTLGKQSFTIGARVSGPRGVASGSSDGLQLSTTNGGLSFFYGVSDTPTSIRLGQSLDLAPHFNFGFYLDASKYSLGQYRLSSVSQALPPGLTLDTNSGQLTGIPLASGQFELQFEVELIAQGQMVRYPSAKLVLNVGP